MTNTESENIISLSCSRILFCYSFLKTVSFFFILCLSLCSFCLWSAPLPPARRIHDKAWRPAVDTGFSDTGRLLTALAYFSCLFVQLTFFFFFFGMIIFKWSTMGCYSLILLNFYHDSFRLVNTCITTGKHWLRNLKLDSANWKCDTVIGWYLFIFIVCFSMSPFIKSYAIAKSTNV